MFGLWGNKKEEKPAPCPEINLEKLTLKKLEVAQEEYGRLREIDQILEYLEPNEQTGETEGDLKRTALEINFYPDKNTYRSGFKINAPSYSVYPDIPRALHAVMKTELHRLRAESKERLLGQVNGFDEPAKKNPKELAQ